MIHRYSPRVQLQATPPPRSSHVRGRIRMWRTKRKRAYTRDVKFSGTGISINRVEKGRRRGRQGGATIGRDETARRMEMQKGDGMLGLNRKSSRWFNSLLSSFCFVVSRFPVLRFSFPAVSVTSFAKNLRLNSFPDTRNYNYIRSGEMCSSTFSQSLLAIKNAKCKFYTYFILLSLHLHFSFLSLFSARFAFNAGRDGFRYTLITHLSRNLHALPTTREGWGRKRIPRVHIVRNDSLHEPYVVRAINYSNSREITIVHTLS